jgi:hypothetical protein
MDKVFAAFIHCHEYVGDRLIFGFVPTFFNIAQAESFVSEINFNSLPDSIGNLASIIKQINIFILVGTGDSVKTIKDCFGRVKLASFLLKDPHNRQSNKTSNGDYRVCRTRRNTLYLIIERKCLLNVWQQVSQAVRPGIQERNGSSGGGAM